MNGQSPPVHFTIPSRLRYAAILTHSGNAHSETSWRKNQKPVQKGNS